MSKKKKYTDPMVLARKALDDLWKNEAQLKGRCWGPVKPDNPYMATNITIAIGNEMISISWDRKRKKFVFHEFRKTKNTSLGRKMKKIVRALGLPCN